MRRFEVVNSNELAVWQGHLLDNAKSKMGNAWGFDHSYAFQFNLLAAELIEQAGPLTKQDGYEM
jgi:hypothetical protein